MSGGGITRDPAAEALYEALELLAEEDWAARRAPRVLGGALAPYQVEYEDAYMAAMLAEPSN